MLEKFRVVRDKELNIANIHDRLLKAYGNRESVFLDKGDEMRYKAFACERVSTLSGNQFLNRVGNTLKELGVKPGERVAVCTANKIDLPLMLFGIMKMGAVAVPLNWQLKQDEIAYIVENCGAKTMIVDREVFDNSIKDKKNIEGVERWIMSGPEQECLDGFLSLDELTARASPEMDPAPISDTDPVAIFYTSGTTGFPKGALMTSKALITGQKFAAALLPTNMNKDFGILALPIAHIMGFCASLMGMISGVGGLYMSKFNPRRVLEAIERHRATFFVGVPAMYAMMLAEGIEKYDLSSMKVWCSAADAMPAEHVEIFRKKGGLIKVFGRPLIPALFVEAYGMVELAGISMIKFNLPGIRFARGCVGMPVYPYRVKVLKEDGTLAKPGEVGEIWVKGPGVTKGYFNNPEASSELIRDGWLNTGDLGKKNRLGLIYFVDRKKDMIKTGGYSVFSVEVEHKLINHPKISRAVVFGVPHPTKKEIPVAVVCLKPGQECSEKEIIDWAHEHMAAYKAPRMVKIIPESEIPMGMTLKVLKRELKQRYEQEFVSRLKE